MDRRLKLNFDQSSNKHKPLTKRQFIDWSADVKLLKRPDIFRFVGREQFVAEMQNPQASEFLRMLGWNYRDAMRTAIAQGGVILYSCHPKAEWRFMGLTDFELNDDLALEMISTLDSCLGDVLEYVEYVEEAEEATAA
jgi:hypothetical protein